MTLLPMVRLEMLASPMVMAAASQGMPVTAVATPAASEAMPATAVVDVPSSPAAMPATPVAPAVTPVASEMTMPSAPEAAAVNMPADSGNIANSIEADVATSLVELHKLPLQACPPDPSSDAPPVNTGEMLWPPRMMLYYRRILVAHHLHKRTKKKKKTYSERTIRERKTPLRPFEVRRKLALWNEKPHQRQARLAIARAIKSRNENHMNWRLPRHMKRQPPPLPVEEMARPKRLKRQIAFYVERRFLKYYSRRCYCGACHRTYRELKTMDTYVCCIFGCKQKKFHDLADFLEHQWRDHGTMAMFCKRVRGEHFRQQQGARAYPPETVYIDWQFHFPSIKPVRWTMEQIEQEHARLFGETTIPIPVPSSIPMPTLKKTMVNWIGFAKKSFQSAYNRIKLYGESQLNEQYRVALEYYESALVFPIGPRNRQDTFATVGRGRNWLLSPDPENAENARVLKKKNVPRKRKRGIPTEDSDGSDDEVVLWEDGDNEDLSLANVARGLRRSKKMATGAGHGASSMDTTKQDPSATSMVVCL